MGIFKRLREAYEDLIAAIRERAAMHREATEHERTMAFREGQAPVKATPAEGAATAEAPSASTRSRKR